MTDIRVAPSNIDPFLPPVAVSFDWLMTPVGQFDTTYELVTAVIVALGTDRLAEDDDILPGWDTDRRGWWGDLDAAELHNGWPLGSRLWLLGRHKITGSAAAQGSSTARAREYAYEALQPFIDQGICRDVEVSAVRSAIDKMDLTVTLIRGPEPDVTVRYQTLWGDVERLASLPAPVGPYGV
jgi:phage gp46-like protein